jgi:hypothetical protein
MTLLDAPKFDDRKEKRKRIYLWSGLGLFWVVLIGWWLVAGRPVDWPWYWNQHLRARITMNAFLSAVEKNDLPKAYAIWHNDKNWQQHAPAKGPDTFERFQDSWSPDSHNNDYGSIQSHVIAAERRYGNGVILAALINGRKSHALNLFYYPKNGTLDYLPPDTELYLGK